MATQEQYNPPEGPEATPPKRARRRAAKPTTGAENALAAFDELNGRAPRFARAPSPHPTPSTPYNLSYLSYLSY